MRQVPERKVEWMETTVKQSKRCGMSARAILILAIPLIVASVAGCNSFFNSWFDPSQVGSFTRETTLDIRTSLSIQDPPIGIPGATDPRPEDLIPWYDEYRVVPGDVLLIRIFELLARNTETNAQATVDELGTINMPVLGQVRVAGMTRSEVTQELVDILNERGLINNATVLVEPALRRGQTFVIFGATPGPNLYPLSRPDTRLLEVLNISGGFVETVTEIYVIRKESRGATMEGIGSARRSDPRLASGGPRDGSSPSNSVGLLAAHRSGGFAGGELPARSMDDEDEPPVTNTQSTELIEAVPSPTGEQPPAKSDEEDQPEIEAQEPVGQPRWIFRNQQWIEITSPAERQTTEPITEELPGTIEQPAAPIDWDRLAGDQETRVIRVSADALRDGDYRQNIVIRPGDTIRVIAGQVGEYYMMGQVFRPGAYSTSGRRITLKTAIASAGNLAPLAWPDRCTIYRRYGDREEMHQVNLDAIFAGKEPDVLLKNNDLVLVGTHPAAPFLAVFRNAFRMTYGFGFVYDRNFADVDSYGSQPNPVYTESTSRFPNLFR